MKVPPSFLLGFGLLGGATATFGNPPKPVVPAEIAWDSELVITDIAVVEDWADPKRRFTLEHLFEGIAKDGNPETAVRQWLDCWVSVQGEGKDKKTLQIGRKLLEEWETRDKADPQCMPAGRLCFKHAPFRLLAIVNRPDKQERDANRQPHSAGEVRFVFGLIDQAGNLRNGTVIFEYDVKGETAKELHDWQKQWHDLRAHVPFKEKYCEALATITEQVVHRGARPERTNGSALKQIRTNEEALSEQAFEDQVLWNLREFHLDKSSGAIVVAPTEQTPSSDLGNTPTLVRYLNKYTDEILAGTHKIRPVFEQSAFLGSQANIPLPASDYFWLPGEAFQCKDLNDPRVRHLFALNTCNGCHGIETGANNLHIAPRNADRKAAILSGFLDSSKGDTTEILNRKTFMCGALNRTRVPAPLSLMWGFLPSKEDSLELLRLIEARAGRAH